MGEQIKVNEKQLDRAAFKAAFVIGWIECVGSKEPDKVKMTQIEEAAANNYLKDHHA